MSQISEIPASAYTREMETLGALPDIPTFDGEPVPVSRNPLTPGTRPLQLLPLPGSEFPFQYETSQMRGFQSESLEQLRDAAKEMRGATLWLRDAAVLEATYFEQSRGAAMEWRDAGAEMHYASVLLNTQLVNLGKARSGGSATDASAFWDLLDPLTRARVIAAGFGDYAAGLRRTQPRFPPAMHYALMERWNDCTLFGFGEMPLTPTDYAAITGLHFTGPVPPLDARYQTAAIGAQLVRSLLGVTTQTRYTVQGCMSYETARLPEVLEYIQRFGFARSYIGRLYSDVHERELGNGRLQRHQSRQSSAVS
ncbi:hypothetical protein JCGZ_16921 [Jatropha curcas]|uniref:Aminotransferase-like plant mobile domain-containing protein n=1 Tax=Jatropha curcas TaxID=180498 RepID=A0A067K6F6_JATCU|nr:hypothetical protein JCGZ_16921 [Jatropha curcas]